MKTKYFLVFLALLLSQISMNYAVAQKCLLFKYDASGNRVNKNVINNCLEMKNIMEVVENHEVADVMVYPNPTEGKFKIITPENIINDHSCYILYDINGVLIKEGLLAYETGVEICDMPPGIYLLKIISGDDTFSKIVLKN